MKAQRKPLTGELGHKTIAYFRLTKLSEVLKTNIPSRREKQTVGKRGCSLRTYRYKLLNLKDRILVTLGIKFREMGESKHEAGEDSANAFHEEFIRMRLNRMLYEQLLQVEDALHRLDSGDYGTCGGCGTPISPKRLKVIPWVKYCVPCQDKINSLYGDEEFSTEREVDYAGTSKSPIN